MLILRLLLFLIPLLLLAGGIALWIQWQSQQRRQQIRQREFSDTWHSIIRSNFPLFFKLPADLQLRMEELIQLFLHEKSFEGCGGLAITDEIRVTIAAQACLLVLNNGQPLYPNLRTILVYPSTYKSNNRESLFHYMHEDAEARLGESWSTGSVVLAWDSVLTGGINGKDGHNVTFHEFAHQLDQVDGPADGAPILQNRDRYASWARVLTREYEALVDESDRGKKSFFDHYGATEPAEFFAVVTETFFEKPKKMQQHYPELYQEFKTFYQLEPAKWEQ